MIIVRKYLCDIKIQDFGEDVIRYFGENILKKRLKNMGLETAMRQARDYTNSWAILPRPRSLLSTSNKLYSAIE